MPYTIKHNSSLGVIELTYSGLVTGADLKEATSECISLGKQTGATKFLVDEAGMELAASFVDLLKLPEVQYVNEEADRQGRVAVVLPASGKARDAVQFFEIACKNRGWFVQTFSDRQSAMDWLRGDPATDKAD